MPSALSYGCKCPHALLTAAKCQHALLTAAKCQHALAGDLGFRVVVVVDATAAHEATSYDGRHYSAQTVHEVALSYGCGVPARAWRT